MLDISRKYLWALFPVIFLVLLVFGLLRNETFLIDISIYSVIASVGLYLLLCKKDLFIGLCIFFIPISVSITPTNGASIIAPSELMTVLLALVVIGLGLSRPVFHKRLLLHPISILLFIDLGWMLLVSFTSEMPEISFKRVIVRGIFLVVFYLLLSHWMIKKENLIKFFLFYTLGLLVPIVITEIHHSAYNFNPKTVYELCKPFFPEHTSYGASIAYVLPFLLVIAVKARDMGLSKSFRNFSWVLFGIFCFAELLAFFRAAWLSLAASLMMFIFLKLKLKFGHFISVIILAIGLIIFYQDPLYMKAKENDNLSNRGEIGEHLMSVGNINNDASNLERINRWRCAYKMFHDRPVTGFGPGTYQFVYGPYQSVFEMTYISTTAGDKGNAHSEPLTYLAETGLPGFLIYIGWLFATIGFGIRAYYRTKDLIIKNMILAAILGFTTFFFHGLVNSFIDQIKIASLLFGSMAIIVTGDVFGRSTQQSSINKLTE